MPFADAVAELANPAAIRLRRDFQAVLSLIKAHALLHQATRPRDERGLAAVPANRQPPRRGVEAAAAPVQRRGAGPADGSLPSQPVRFESRYQGLVLFGALGVGAVQFNNGRFKTSETAVIEWLRRHPGHGIEFHEVGRA